MLLLYVPGLQIASCRQAILFKYSLFADFLQDYRFQQCENVNTYIPLLPWKWFFFQSKQLFTFFNRSVRLTFSAHEWSCQFMLLTWVKLLHEEKDIWITPQERTVSFWWVHGCRQRALYQITYISTLVVRTKWNIVTEIFQYWLFFKENISLGMMGGILLYSLLNLLWFDLICGHMAYKKSLFNAQDLSKMSHK